MAEQVRIPSTDGAELEGHLAAATDPVPPAGVLLLHGFPSGAVWAGHIGSDLPELADRIAEDMGWATLALRFRGCGSSTGDFSLAGWVADVHAALSFLTEPDSVRDVWIIGFGTGGTVGLVAADKAPAVAGVAMAGSPADLDDWAENAARMVAHAHQVGAIKTPAFPPDVATWADEFRSVGAAAAAERFGDRSLFMLHGADDDVVPQVDARLLADAHGAAELRIISGAGHQLRHDPRAVSMLLGWLSRQISESERWD